MFEAVGVHLAAVELLGRHRFDPVDALATVVLDERERIARLWAKRLKLELNELEARTRDIREPLSWMIGELGRLLRDRGEDAVRLWPEVIRSHGASRYDLRFEPEDIAHELKALHQVLIRVYVKSRGAIEPEVAELLSEILGEASAAVQASWARVLRTEEVRLREAAVMESLLEHIDVGILLAEEDGRLSWATPPVTRLIGLPARVFVGAGVEAIRSMLVQLNARHLSGEAFRASDMPYFRALKEKHEIRRVTMAIDHHPDGREMILEMTAIPVREEGTDELYGVVQTLVDRTDTTHKTRQLSEAYEQLRRLQGRLLQKTRNQALGQLASGAAHNLNNFLNVMRLRLTLLRREYKPQYLDALDKTVNSVSELVARLQDFSSNRGGEEEVTDVSFNQIVQESTDLMKSELEKPDAVVEVKKQLEGQPLVRADPASLRELLVNLVLSSRGRMPQGGTMTLRSRSDGSWVELEVEDTGEPYSQDDLTRLFDPLKGPTPAPQLSLLLAMGRNQVQRWGGELWAENVGDGRGARFHLRLPVAVPQEKPPPRPEAPIRPPGRRLTPRRVLVVDDDPDNARMLGQVLHEEGYDVGVAQSGSDALELWKGGHFEAALLDALMPDMSGWAIAREIRSQTPNALLAVVTGGDVRGQNRENLALVDAVFRKPVDVGALDDFLAQPEPLPVEEEEGGEQAEREGQLPPVH
ncbi:MAG: response regulator [Myxococcaceae bacterium]